MIELKEGLGGNGLQPYDTKNGKWIKIKVFIGDTPVEDFNSYREAFLDAQPKYRQLYVGENKQKIDAYLQPFYNKLLQQRVEELNQEDFDSLEGAGETYNTVEDMCKNIGKFFNQEMFDDMLNKTVLYDAYGKGVPGIASKWLVDFHKRRFGRVKFKRISEVEFQYLSKQQGAQILYRGLGDLPDKIKDNIFEGFSRDGEGLSKTLLANGTRGRMIGAGIYMTERKDYSLSSYTLGSNMLIKCVYNENDCKVVDTSYLNNLRYEISENNILKEEISKYVSPDKVDDVVEKLLDLGVIAMMMGYDRVKLDNDVSTVINPNKMYVSSEWEGN